MRLLHVIALLTGAVLFPSYSYAQSEQAAESLLAESAAPTDTLPSFEPKPDTYSSPKGRESVGLVLSGGGAKGIAHVGVIKALEDNDIPIDYVTGTSMGAIVGSLYSCGWSPERMLEFFTAPDFLDWATERSTRSTSITTTSSGPRPNGWRSMSTSRRRSHFPTR